MATKTLRVTLADLLGKAGPTGRVHGEVWARFVDANGAPREVHYTDGTVVTIAQPRVALDSNGVADFVVVPNDDASIVAADRGFGIQVGWDLTQRGAGGGKVSIVNTGKVVGVTSASPAVVQYGLLDPFTPVMAGTTYVTQSTADATYAPASGSGVYETKATVATKANALAVTSFVPLKAALRAADRSCGVQVMGDSTGNETSEWVYTLAQSVAALYPAWSVHYRLWNDTTQQYGANTVIQTGTAGVRYLDGSTGTSTRALDPTVSQHITGAIDVRVKMNLADWTPTNLTAVIGRSGGDPLRGWYCGINSVGSGSRPFFTWSTGGLAADLQTMTVLATPTVADGADLWMRWVWNPNDGAGNRTLAAYQSTDGATWTQIGSTVTTAGTTTLYNNSARGYEIGGVANGGVTTMKTYEVQIRDGVDGPNVVPALPDLWPPINTSAAQVVGAPILTFVNGSQPGANIAYHTAAGRLKKMTPDFGQLVTFISDSHNEGLLQGQAWLNTYDSFRTSVETEVPGSPVVVLTQNPEQSGTSWYREHAKRRLDLMGYARQKGLGLIDTYQAFLDAGWPGSMMLDDIHPNSTGQVVWKNAILDRFNAS